MKLIFNDTHLCIVHKFVKTFLLMKLLGNQCTLCETVLLYIPNKNIFYVTSVVVAADPKLCSFISASM